MAKKSLALVVKDKRNQKLLSAALTKGIDKDRFLRTAWIQIQQNDDLRALSERNPSSVFKAMLQCAQMGLYPDGVSGEAYLVPFKNECVAIRGYKGLMKLFAETPNAASLPFVCDYVREGDEFEYAMGANPRLTHRPALDPGRDNRPITHFYAVARFSDGSTLPLVMSLAQVEKHKAYSKTKKFWDSSDESTWIWMRLKTVIRQLAKQLPLSTDVGRTMDDDDDMEPTTAHIFGDEVAEPVVEGEVVEDGEPPMGQAVGDPGYESPFAGGAK